MAAFALVELEKEGNYEGKARKKGAVLRVPTSTAVRWTKNGTAKAYSGQKTPENADEKAEAK